MTGIAAECKDSIGGIKAAYIAEHADVASLTETQGVITAITMATGKTFKPFVFRKETGNFTSRLEASLNFYYCRLYHKDITKYRLEASLNFYYCR